MHDTVFSSSTDEMI